MLNFESDYNNGTHPLLLKRLTETNDELLSGYGDDPYTERAKMKIRECIQNPNADIFFISGGTQTNQTVIGTVLKPYEGVIAAKTGHINVHEAGAIEYTGHKVLEVPSYEGKLRADDIRSLLDTFYADKNHEHMIFPGMVYISFPTEYGTIYTKTELTQIHGVCVDYDIPLFIDGARLGYGLAALTNDVSIVELANLCDIFYIGGTKVGALCGEALIFTKHNTPAHFIGQIKQHGALLAKGRLMGVQFDTLFTDNLYFEIAENAIQTAEQLKAILQKHRFRFYIDSPTNQQFVIIDNLTAEKLGQYVKFGFWEKYGENHSVVRFATSWATRSEDLCELDKILDSIL